ncbi:DoxX family membrane protein [Mucilaginibacter agri]|uniref:DoxX family membrane protein n=1 Tax=Mucilaginibacter agri TaxID=2695265 RepID=A0A965ZIB1_9SPHI|nr:DoxX family membrane protein [Mucilaginibacter agri]NCD70216.1 DoxX family membrane protein [Mucilaginibacter agri]
MENYNRLWRFFFAVALIAIAVQQLIVGDIRPVIIPPAYPLWLQQGRLIFTWVLSLLMIAACVLIVFELKAHAASILLGYVLLLFVFTLQLPYQLAHYPGHLGVWTDPLKELSLAGGAFLVAASLPQYYDIPTPLRILSALGRCFFCVTMILFGIDHFLYPDFVKMLVPEWLPGNLFWTYFAGIALMLAGIAIIINVKTTLAATLLGIMIFLWLVMLHIPRAIADPNTGHGNELTSVFEALAFSGIAFLIAGSHKKLSISKRYH